MSRRAAELCLFLTPSALEAFSQLPMAVRDSSKITQGVEEMPQLCETLSGLLSCSPPPAQASLATWMLFPQEATGPKRRVLSWSRNVVVSGMGSGGL